jgi:4-amino-4-deoxy-L-arabinose transferase-like glycosyltransferase
MGARAEPISTPAGSPVGRRLRDIRSLVAAHPWLILVPFIAVFVAVPLLAPANANLYDDEAGYLGLAKNLVHGHYLTGRDDAVAPSSQYPNLWFGPGLPLVLTPFVALHVPLTVTRMIGPLFLFLAVLLFYGLLRISLPQRLAVAGAAALAVYIPFYTVIAFLHSEALAIFLVVATMYGTALYLREGRMRHLAIAGAALGSLALTKVVFGWIATVLLAVFLLAWAFRRSAQLRRLVLVPALALVVSVPWLAYTFSVTDKPFYWGSSAPLSLYWMSSPRAADRGDWHGADTVFRDERLAPHRPFFRSLIGLDLQQQNRAFRHAALQDIRHEPLKYVENVLANISRMLFNAPYSFKRPKPTALVYALPNAILLVALAASLIRARRRRVRWSVEAFAFGSLAVVGFGLQMLFSAYPRFLFPLVPVAVWFVLQAFGSRGELDPRMTANA